MADGEIEVEAMNGDPPIPPTSNLGSVANGDQLKYEIDNANVPPEQRSDWPLPSFDARDWAKAFGKGTGFGILLFFAVTGLTHKESYRDIFAVTLIKTLAVFFVIGVYYTTGIV